MQDAPASMQDRLARADRAARAILGVDEAADREAIRRAWLRLCRETHPDTHPGDAIAAERFLFVQAAYEFLADGTPSRRLFDLAEPPAAELRSAGYCVENDWGYVLWWRDRFGF